MGLFGRFVRIRNVYNCQMTCWYRNSSGSPLQSFEFVFLSGRGAPPLANSLGGDCTAAWLKLSLQLCYFANWTLRPNTSPLEGSESDLKVFDLPLRFSTGEKQSTANWTLKKGRDHSCKSQSEFVQGSLNTFVKFLKYVQRAVNLRPTAIFHRW